MKRVGFITAIALSLAMAPVVRAAELTVPACDALLGWAKTYHPSRGTEIAPKVTLDNIFANDVSTKVFGKPALEWNRAEIGAVNKALAQCRGQYRKKRDKKAAQALRTARGRLGRSLRVVTRYQERLDKNIENVRTRLQRYQPTPASYRQLADFDTADELTKRFRGLAGAPADKVEAIAKEVRDFRAKIRGDAVAEATKAIEGLPAETRSLLEINKQIDSVNANFGDAADSEDYKALTALAEKRRKTIREKVVATAGDTPPMIFPECDAFFTWAAATDMRQPIRTGTGSFYNTMMDDQLVPVFGRPLDKWTDDDVALFRDGMQGCMQRPRTAAQTRQPGQYEAQQIGNFLPSARAMLAKYKEANTALAEAGKKIKEAPATFAGIQTLYRLRSDPALAGLTPQDRQRLSRTIQFRQGQIANSILAESAKKLGEFKGGLDDMKKIADYRNRTLASLGRLANPNQIKRFEASFRAQDAKVAAATLPEFKKKLAALPVRPESAKVAMKAANDLVKPRLSVPPPARGAIPTSPFPAYVAPFRDAAKARSEEIEAALHQMQCKKVLAEVDLSSSEAREPVLGALGPTTMGDVVCRLVMSGGKFHDYDSPGLLGSDYKLKVTAGPGGYQTITLHKAEYAPGKKALIGKSVADANTTHEMTVQQWQAYAAMLTGQSAAAGMKMLEQVFKDAAQQMRQMQRNSGGR